MASLLPDDGSPGFGVYVHWPFCAAKCPYCDFNSHVRHKPVDQARFAAAFRRELATMRSRTGPKEVSSIFIGGGTPSLMKPETVGAILEAVAELWTVPDGIEITMEANPQSADAGRFAGYRAAGVNRLSLGVQALNDADLKFLGRLHDAGEALQAIELARRTFPRLSFDLIYARPGQTLAGWKAELESAIAHAAALTDESGYCPIDADTMRSEADPAIYVLGDAAIAGDMPKSGFGANSQAKVAAMAIRAELLGSRAFPARYSNTCWSLIAPDDAVKVGAEYAPTDGRIAAISSFISQTHEDAALRKANAEEAQGWYTGMIADTFGG